MEAIYYCIGASRGGTFEPVESRVLALNHNPIRSDARYVLYWAQMNRRVSHNHALAYAIGNANSLGLPVLVYEGLTYTYPHANDRLHSFLLEGVPDMEEALTELGAGYCFYLRRRKSDPNHVLYRLARDAALLVTDDYPTFVAATHNASVPKKISVACHAVDSSCIVPMRLFGKREYAAYTIRPKIHRLLSNHLQPFRLPKLRQRWTDPTPAWHVAVSPDVIPNLVASCEIDHSVPPSTAFSGGSENAAKRVRHFLRNNLRRYARERNDPAAHATSDLSPYLHFGHISALEVALQVRDHAEKHKLSSAEFLEELIVRRELAFNFALHARIDSLDSLPDWAAQTLAEHAGDIRDPSFTRDQMERAETYDPLWNATQKELLLRGKIHGYYRMYWGKKIIEWSPTNEEALRSMIYFHDRYALDGRDPNTYTNILWCFGLHDRPWFERPIFGKVRYMSYDGMKRKTSTDAYLREIEHLERTGRDFTRI
jgi:deoxyribodipyrimidine photo-lyase